MTAVITTCTFITQPLNQCAVCTVPNTTANIMVKDGDEFQTGEDGGDQLKRVVIEGGDFI